MKTIDLPVKFQTNDYYPEDVGIIRIELSDEKMKRILELQEFLKNNDDIWSISLHSESVEYLTHDKPDEESDYRAGSESILVYPHSCYLESNDKYSSQNQIESGAFQIEKDLTITLIE